MLENWEFIMMDINRSERPLLFIFNVHRLFETNTVYTYNSDHIPAMGGPYNLKRPTNMAIPPGRIHLLCRC